MRKPERREPLNPLYNEWQKPSDSRIDEIQWRLTEKRARKIVCAVFAALNPHENASLPKNPFRNTDTADDAFEVVVAADQKLTPVYVSANPPHFVSVASDSGRWKPVEAGTENEHYCAEIKAAIQALMTGKKITPASNPSPETSQVAPAPPTAGKPQSSTSDQPMLPSPPKTPSRQARPPLGSAQWWSAPASPPPAPPSPIPSPPSPGPAPPAPNSAPPPANIDGWDDEKWPDSE